MQRVSNLVTFDTKRNDHRKPYFVGKQVHEDRPLINNIAFRSNRPKRVVSTNLISKKTALGIHKLLLFTLTEPKNVSMSTQGKFE